ncbi:mitochondrial import inner membrane translocase subunit Tim29 [Hylaeus anthracinus]|uniref:mitochondrial import inner membrane translocase subunit Tim29 n=1 Tax=Hylaeus anthracinus TaxID=313031 RepID=UPI0023B8BFA0|nr:mitochondrial import inner membrane translocase subunit Tim29 [Hylaeus anthracinus]
MNYGQVSRLQKYKLISKLTNLIGNVSSKVKNFETPERLKGTFLERWGKYWKNVYIDYKDVADSVVKDCRERPIRASVYASFIGLGVYMNKHNPDECIFREQLLQSTMKVMQVGQSIRNPISEHHVKWLGQCYNEGIIRQLNLGIVSLIWLDNYDEACSLYKASCSYLKPRYITFYHRVVDVGFLDTWWVLESRMKDYDVNEAEFSNVEYA